LILEKRLRSKRLKPVGSCKKKLKLEKLDFLIPVQLLSDIDSFSEILGFEVGSKARVNGLDYWFWKIITIILWIIDRIEKLKKGLNAWYRKNNNNNNR